MKPSRIETDSMAKRLQRHQTDVLELAFQESDHLNKQKKTELAAATGLDVEQIASWFSRKRARKRAKGAMVDLEAAHSRLQQELKRRRESEAEMQKELEESREREADMKLENKLLKRRVTIAEADRQLESLMRVTNGRFYI